MADLNPTLIMTDLNPTLIMADLNPTLIMADPNPLPVVSREMVILKITPVVDPSSRES